MPARRASRVVLFGLWSTALTRRPAVTAKVKGTGRGVRRASTVTSTPWRARSSSSLTQGSTAPNLGTAPAGARRRTARTEKGKITVVPGFEDAVEEVLRAIPRGEVMTYGEVAAEAGYPGAARAVGTLLSRSGGTLPWWRVVAANGRLVPGHEPEHATRLRAEGVKVVDGRRCAWPGRDR